MKPSDREPPTRFFFYVAIGGNIYYNSVKRQGSRTDIKSETSPQLDEKSSAAWEKTKSIYGESRNTIERYSQLYRLTDGMKKRLDDNDFGTTPALAISSMSEAVQQLLDMTLSEDPAYKIDMTTAKELKDLYDKNNDLTEEDIEEILSREKSRPSVEMKSIPFPRDVYDEFFKPEQTAEEITNELIEALKSHRAKKADNTTAD